MIEQAVEADAWRALHAQPAPLVTSIAALCIASGASLIGLYASEHPDRPLVLQLGERAPDILRTCALDFETILRTARECGLRIRRHPILDADGTLAIALFGTSYDDALDDKVVGIAASLFGSALTLGNQLAHHSRVSNRLQRALLPAKLVHADEIVFDAAYIPASNEAEVGGDWYDTFEVGNGCIGISVGDVTGHGLDAAVTMSEMRHAIRAAASAHSSPTAILNAVDAMATSQETGIASAIVGIIDPATSVMRYASAGHPAPIFVTSAGSSYVLPGGGSLLGLGLSGASPERTITLLSGARCVFYTDGLTEHNRDVIAGEELLLRELDVLAAKNAVGAASIHERVIGSSPRDDCATLVVSSLAKPLPYERHVFTSVPSSARLFRDAVRTFVNRAGISGDQQFSIIVAAGEAIANAIEHGDSDASGSTILEMTHENGELHLNVESRGHWRNTDSENRGRGVTIMRAYARRLSISSTSARTRVSLTF